MAIADSTSLPIFKDVVDDLRELVSAISFVAQVTEPFSSVSVGPEIARARALLLELLAERLEYHLDLLERFGAVITPFRQDQEALSLVVDAAQVAGTTPADILRRTFGGG